MTNTEKVETILRHDFIEWQSMSKDQLLEQLTKSHRVFLEDMLSVGGGNYLDQRLEEIRG